MAASDSDKLAQIVWWELEAVPDVLRGNGLLNSELTGKLQEHYSIWRGLVQGLDAFADEITLCLRYRTVPEFQRLCLFVGCRIERGFPVDEEQVRSIEAIVIRQFDKVGAKPVRLYSDDKAGPEKLSWLFPPAQDNDGVVHLCQWFGRHNWQVAKTRLEEDKKKWRWSLRPFGEAAGTLSNIPHVLFHDGMRSVGQSLDRGRSDFCCFSVYLSPTRTTDEEAQWLWNQAMVLNRHSYIGQRTEDESAGILVDRALEIESNNVQHFIANLEPAFLVLGEVFVHGKDLAENQQLAMRMAKAIAATVDGNQQIPQSPAFPELLSGKCLVAEPQQTVSRNEFGDYAERVRNEQDTEDAREYALDAYQNLKIRHWISWARGMDEIERRIPYLCNAGGASVLMRLPVDLGNGLPGIPVRQAPPDFDPGDARIASGSSLAQEPLIDQEGELASKRKREKRSILLGQLHSGGQIRINEDDLTRHTLIVGNTGSGKTITTQHLLKQLSVPFLVLETAKTEYRKLAIDPEFKQPVNIYTPGSEGVVPIRLNPFELLPGVRVESHIGALQTCFEASMPISGPLFAILEEALVSVYLMLKWRVDEARPPVGERSKPFPTMTLFAARLRQIAKERGYSDRVESDITAAISGRISPLTLASGTSKGKMLDCHLSHPPLEQLFTESTVLELNDLRAEEKALVSMLVMVFLREFREMARQSSGWTLGLKHVTVIEEAHNVLASQAEKSGEETANTRHAAVERFSNMLTEMRSSGEGIVIADQSPHKILPDALRNTNLQIVHQLRANDDREAVASSMVMSREQGEFVAKLRIGNAAVFFSGLERATFVKIPFQDLDKDSENDLKVSEVNSVQAIRDLMSKRQPENGMLWSHPRRWPFRGCLHCPERGTCPVREAGEQIANFSDSEHPELISAVLTQMGSQGSEFDSILQFHNLVNHRRKHLKIANSPAIFWCSMTHALSSNSPNLTLIDSGSSQLEKLKIQLNNRLQTFKVDFKKRKQKG